MTKRGRDGSRDKEGTLCYRLSAQLVISRIWVSLGHSVSASVGARSTKCPRRYCILFRAHAPFLECDCARAHPVSGVRVDSMTNRCVSGVVISTLAVSLEELNVWTAEANLRGLHDLLFDG